MQQTIAIGGIRLSVPDVGVAPAGTAGRSNLSVPPAWQTQPPAQSTAPQSDELLLASLGDPWMRLHRAITLTVRRTRTEIKLSWPEMGLSVDAKLLSEAIDKMQRVIVDSAITECARFQDFVFKRNPLTD